MLTEQKAHIFLHWSSLPYHTERNVERISKRLNRCQPLFFVTCLVAFITTVIRGSRRGTSELLAVFAAKPAPWCEAGALLRRQLIRRQLGVQRRRGRRITRTPSLCLTPLIELRKRRWSWIEVPVRQVTGVVAHFHEKPLFDCILVLLDFMRKLPSKAELHCICSITSPCVTICFLTLLLLTFVRLQSVTDLCSYSWGTRRLACRSHRSEYTPLGRPHSAPLLTLYSSLLPSVYNWPYCGTSFGSVTL